MAIPLVIIGVACIGSGVALLAIALSHSRRKRGIRETREVFE